MSSPPPFLPLQQNQKFQEKKTKQKNLSLATKQKIPTKRIERNNISLGTKRKNWTKIEQKNPKIVHTNRAKELIHAYWKHEKRSPKGRACWHLSKWDTQSNKTRAPCCNPYVLVKNTKREFLCLSKTWDYHNLSPQTCQKESSCTSWKHNRTYFQGNLNFYTILLLKFNMKVFM